MINHYSPNWYDSFLRPVSVSQTESEVAFLVRNLPRARYRSVVDLCCGTGRHARRLAAEGYEVTGIDNNHDAIEQAKRLSDGGIRYSAMDMRRMDKLPQTYDALINMWQSFGYFDEETNQAILCQIGRRLNRGGRLILDLYHRDFFEQNQGVRTFEKAGRKITENKRMVGNRLCVTLSYDQDKDVDSFEWQLYTPEELMESLESAGFGRVIGCTDFHESLSPSSDKPRMQFVFQKQ